MQDKVTKILYDFINDFETIVGNTTRRLKEVKKPTPIIEREVCSDTNPRLKYFIRVFKPEFQEYNTCGCPAFMYRKDKAKFCKHIQRELWKAGY